MHLTMTRKKTNGPAWTFKKCLPGLQMKLEFFEKLNYISTEKSPLISGQCIFYKQ